MQADMQIARCVARPVAELPDKKTCRMQNMQICKQQQMHVLQNRMAEQVGRQMYQLQN